MPGAPASLARLWSSAELDGAVYAEPLVAGGCVYVATEDDSIYALDASTGVVRWHVHLAAPITSGLPCGDIDPSGITGTPVLDAARGLIWAVVLTDVKGTPTHELVGLRSGDGAVVRRQVLAVPGTNPAAQQQRAALDIEDGNVYVAFGGLYGDCNDYVGAVASVPEAAGHAVGYWRVPTRRGAGIWEPGGPDLLPDGNLLLADGNGAAGPGQPFDGSDAVVELSPALREVGYFAPSDWAQLDQQDGDLGTTGPALVPGNLAVQVGKTGVGYLVSTAHLGRVGGQLDSLQVCEGAGAYGSDAVSGHTVYVPCTEDLTALQVGPRSLRVLWRSQAGGAGAPVVAAGRVLEETTPGEVVVVSAVSGRELQVVHLAAPVTHFPWLVAVGHDVFASSGDTVVALRGL